jgi:hypothetical protein
MHDIWQMPDEVSYNTCGFNDTGAQKKSDASLNYSFDFACNSVGTYYFACSVGGACEKGNQKVRIYVSAPQNTVSLRAKGSISLEEFNRKYTLIFAGYYSNKQSLSQVSANEAISAAQSILDHSPESCSDWIPVNYNTDQNCRAFILTDLGFISRVRPDADFVTADDYYAQALTVIPGMCGATSYRAELRVQQNIKVEADAFYYEACQACGEHSIDFTDLFFAYENRSWTPPSCATTSTATTSAAFLSPVNSNSNTQTNDDSTTFFQPSAKASSVPTPSFFAPMLLLLALGKLR